MNMSVAIMAHPSRKRFVDELVMELPDARVVMDKKSDRWDTGRRSLLAYDTGADYHCVVQDDALLCPDFLEGAAKAAEVAGDRPVGLYIGKARPLYNTVRPLVRRALHTGACWIEMPGPWWGVAIIIPRKHIRKLVGWGDDHPEIVNYDKRITHWYYTQEIMCWYTVPSLVNHRPVHENPSLIPGRTGNRRAIAIAGFSATEIDWDVEPITFGGMATVR